MLQKSAVALLSSGLDSSVALNMAQTRGIEVVLALTLDYGQRAVREEIKHARRLADHFKVPHQTLALPWFKEMTSGLLSSVAGLPQPTLQDLSSADYSSASAKAVWVPNRNGVFIEIAAGIAESRGADAVIVGFNREEAATFPDNTEDYMESLSRALAFSTANHVEVISPTSSFLKREIVKWAAKHNFPFELLWSCYESGTQMCGRCESCMRLKRALKENEVGHDSLFQNADLH